MDGHAISFGPFRLLPGQRLLLEGDQPVRLGSRALDILAVLAGNAGRVVPKEELIARVWPKVFVEESNLKIQVSALRRALGDGQGGNRYIVTVPGRGYEFVVPVGLTAEPAAIPVPAVPQPGTHNLPLAATRMIGREEAVAVIVSRVSRERLLTIVGPGGIGKTTLALAVAERMIPDYEGGVWLVDLAPLGDPRLVPSTVATVLGLEIHTETPLPGLIAALRDRRMLLLLDNCEHVIDAAAGLAAAVLSGTLGVDILATSRELLRVTGERGYRLGPLSSPQPLSGASAAETAAFPAVQLFVERATAVVEDFSLTDANAPLMAEICRRLDGLPLAIEFAAPRVAVLGVEGLATQLDRGFPLLRARRRMTMPRHRTMQAVLDWSYSLLSEDEQPLFRALGIFTGGFTAEGAAAVVTDAPGARNDAIDRLADLVAKSLVVADVSGVRPRFRLLETTRAYALERLAESGEREAVGRRHAEYYRNLLGRAEGEVAARPAGEWLADYAPEIDNLRAALDWTFSPDGDPVLGAALAAASINFWVAASLFNECSAWGARALAVEGIDGTREEMVLQFGVGLALTYSKGMTVEARKALTKALRLSETLGDRAYQYRTLYGLFLFTVRNVEIRAALQLAQKYEMVARNAGSAPAIASAEALLGIARYCLGEHLAAADHLSRALISLPTGTHRGVIAFGLDLRVCALCYRALTFWLLGFAERAVQAAEEATNEARDINHPVSLCFVLAVCNSLLLVRIGHLDAAESSINELIEYAGEHLLIPFKAAGMCAKGTLFAARGDAIRAEEMLRAGLEIIEEAGFYLYAPLFLGRWAEALAACGRLDEALAVVERAQQRTEAAELLWFLPEVLRIKGEILLRAGAAVTAVEESFLQSLDLARRQKALAWELRTATSLARFWRGRDRVQEAREVLTAVYGKFTEGLTTADPKAAKALLDSLA